ncbi:MAG: hypothetical protein C5B59_08645 [Bacteroidetes bacterium]|nr:MAG: hypothetical protein C5B59_08645 [Bacteroidota bacterium]
MPVTKTQLTGGAFQDSEGNVLANGYLKMRLNQDGLVNTNNQVCAGIEITINLDSSGNVNASPAQSVWANDVMTPVNSFYKVTGYKQNGQSAWGPNNQQVTSGGTGGGTFDTGTWVPNQITNWTPPLQPLILETNEVQNGSQFLLDLHAGQNITLTDNGSGRVTVATTAPALALQTNETPNGSQSLLDLHAGSNVTLTDNGSGRVTIASVATPGTPLPSSARWGMWAAQAIFQGGSAPSGFFYQNDNTSFLTGGGFSNLCAAPGSSNGAYCSFAGGNGLYYGQKWLWAGRDITILARFCYISSTNGTPLCGVGISDLSTFSAFANAVVIVPSGSTGSPTYLGAVYSGSSLIGTVNSGVVIGSTFHDFKISISGGTATFFIDGTSFGSVGSVPATALALTLSSAQTGGSGSFTTNLEYLYGQNANL